MIAGLLLAAAFGASVDVAVTWPGLSTSNCDSLAADLGKLLEPETCVVQKEWKQTGSRNVWVLRPEGEDWTSHRDEFVPTWRRRLSEKRGPYFYAALAPGMDSQLLREEIEPLFRQAIREAGVQRLDLGPEAVPGRRNWSREAAIQMWLVLSDAVERKKSWKVVEASSEEPGNPARHALDGDPDTLWHTSWSSQTAKPPHALVWDMGKVQTLGGFRYLARNDGINGRVKEFALSGGESLDSLKELAKGELPNTALWTSVRFRATPVRYLQFVALSEQNGGPWASAAELDVIPAWPN